MRSDCAGTTSSRRTVRVARHLQLRRQRPPRLLFLHLPWLLLGLLMAPHSSAAQGLVGGSATRCSREGEAVIIPGITDDPCISCTCRNLQVECEKVKCRELEGCHAILFGLPSDRCCELCKGCKFNGTEYSSGDSWSEPGDPCQLRHCRAGVITQSTEQCFNSCHSPQTVRGQCCPACPGCTFRGQQYKEGEMFPLPYDLCTECRCQNGGIVCSKRVCPVLNCPKSVIYQPPGECCPQCQEMRRIFDVTTRCYFARQIYPRGQTFEPDNCTTCSCTLSGTSVCLRTTCPPIDCPEEERSRTEGGCCQTCPIRRECLFHNIRRLHKEKWRPSPCLECTCEDGVTYCQRERCSNSLWCPEGYELRLTQDSCCPKCVERDAVCTVFGDPHYRTFDGRMFSFQGGCKYILARDCIDNAFNIKVRNGVRFSSGFAWTQMLSVFLGSTRVSLMQNLKVKVDRKRVALPYTKRGILSIRRHGNSVKLRAEMGLQVTWDGDSFVELTVSTRFKSKLCGLCGNYNGMKSDDLTGSDGRLHMNSEDFGNSWRIGSHRTCMSRPNVDVLSHCERDAQIRNRATRVCAVFYEDTFKDCRAVVPVQPYVSSCITDMCDCPSGRYCACEVIKAYVSQCQRLGVKVTRGRQVRCSAQVKCPVDAELVLCSETCPRTCSNQNSVQPCPHSCDAGCLCNQGTVLHDNLCILPEHCPST